MRKFLTTIFLLLAITNSYADKPTKQSVEQARFFWKNYLLLCASKITVLDTVRKKFADFPKFPPKKAKYFDLGGNANAFPVPTKKGHFVVSIAREKNLCGVFGRRGDAELARKSFIDFFEKPQPPLLTELKEDTIEQKNGYTVKRIAYVWSIKGAKRKMVFMLSTSNSTKAPMQLFATAAIINE